MLAFVAPAMHLVHYHVTAPCSFALRSIHGEAKAPHAIPIFVYHPFAVSLWIIAVREEHAFVAGGFLVFANAAGLGKPSLAMSGLKRI